MSYSTCEPAIKTSRASETGVLLQCPDCGTKLGHLPFGSLCDEGGYDCPVCRFAIRSENGIWQALPPDRVAYFSRFIEEYQSIRFAEGRGSLTEDFYVNLPYKDVTGRNAWQWNIRARTFDSLIGKLLPGLFRGVEHAPAILDLGAGNGWMSYRLALAGYRPTAVDLLTNELDGLGAAVHFEKHLGFLFPRFQAELSRLPFAGDQFDAVIFNASFHYAEDYRTAMCEALRCVKEQGTVIIADTPWYSANKSGEQMIAERRDAFVKKYGTASNSVSSIEYLTDERLRDLEQAFNIHWQRTTPFYGMQWTMRPLVARLRGRREPSRFRIYAARKQA